MTLSLDAGGLVDLDASTIQINPLYGAMIHTLVHETLHSTLDDLLGAFLSDLLNEACIIALTTELVTHIYARPRLLTWWSRRCKDLLAQPAS